RDITTSQVPPVRHIQLAQRPTENLNRRGRVICCLNCASFPPKAWWGLPVRPRRKVEPRSPWWKATPNRAAIFVASLPLRKWVLFELLVRGRHGVQEAGGSCAG